MKPSFAALLACAALLTAPTAATRVQTDSIQAAPTAVTANDLASALDMRWWSYKLTFPSPVAGVSLRLCELRRQPSGAWSRTYLAPAFGRRTTIQPGLQDVEVKVLIEDEHPDVVGVKLAGVFQRQKWETRPDFEDTYSPVDYAMFVDGCLALAIDEDIPGYPNATMGNEEYMVRVIGLEITTE
jgi:hypothetical protein